jgi:peptide/nickel transport system substrate-binding protein
VGFKVILKAMDWSTSLIARARKEPPDKGGWNLMYTWWHGADVLDPSVHFGLSGAGSNGWFGWPNVPQLEKLGIDWVRATVTGMSAPPRHRAVRLRYSLA